MRLWHWSVVRVTEWDILGGKFGGNFWGGWGDGGNF